jgi:DMSO/TMAO reductase YedYZ molybdopterin-dependent catalytic subunit
MPIARAMDDCLLCYGMNGEPVRPQQGFPLRLLAPGFEGIFNTKYLRRIKLVDRYYMNYNDYGHLDRDPNEAALGSCQPSSTSSARLSDRLGRHRLAQISCCGHGLGPSVRRRATMALLGSVSGSSTVK